MKTRLWLGWGRKNWHQTHKNPEVLKLGLAEPAMWVLYNRALCLLTGAASVAQASQWTGYRDDVASEVLALLSNHWPFWLQRVSLLGFFIPPLPGLHPGLLLSPQKSSMSKVVNADTWSLTVPRLFPEVCPLFSGLQKPPVHLAFYFVLCITSLQSLFPITSLHSFPSTESPRSITSITFFPICSTVQ